MALLLATVKALAQIVEPTDVIPYVTLAGSAEAEGGPGDNRTIAFTLSLSERTSATVRAQYSLIEGTARAGEDYLFAPLGTLEIPPNQTSTTIRIPIVGDLRDEPDEFFTLQLGGIQNATNAYGPTAVRATIVNDDRFTVTVTGSRVSEGNDDASDATVIVSVSPAATQTVTGTFATADGTATVAGDDYQRRSGSFTIARGQSSAPITVRINGDRDVESDESFVVEVSGMDRPVERATVTIVNDDEHRVTATVSSPKIVEGDSGRSEAIFAVSVTVSDGVPTTLSYATSNGSATAGEDYEPQIGQLAFAAGETSKTVAVPVMGDVKPEGDETFSLNISGEASATGMATIGDDDRGKAASITIVSGNNQSSNAGEKVPLPLVVKVVDSDQKPATGIDVSWKIAKGATAEPATSKTNANGESQTTITLATGVDPVQITASTAFAGEVVFTINPLIETKDLSDVAKPVAQRLDEICNAAKDAQTVAACAALRNALTGKSQQEQEALLESIAPQQGAAQARAITQSLAIITSGINARLAALRGGATAFSIDQVSWNVGGQSIPIGSILQTLGPNARGGAAGDDAGGFSGFITGNLGWGNRPTTDSGTIGYDLDYRGLTVGLDQRRGDRVLGGAVGFMQLDTKLDDGTGDLDTTGYTLSVYSMRTGLLRPRTPNAKRLIDGAYVDGVLTFGRNQYESKHTVPALATTATSDNSATLWSVGATAGLDAHRKAFTFDAFIRASYARASVDGFREKGNSIFNLVVESQDIESLLGTIGIDVSYSRSFAWGVLRPSVRASLLHEFEDGTRLITAAFAGAPDNPFTIPIDDTDRNYLGLAAGVQAIFPHGVSLFLQYSRDAGRSDLDFQSIQVGVRKEF